MWITSGCAILRHHLWLAQMCCIFCYHLNVQILRKTVFNMEHVFRFSPLLLSETFPVPGKIQQDVFINIARSSCKVPHKLPTHTISNSPSASTVVLCRQTNGQTDMTKLVTPSRMHLK
jgi:hypothetical protein